MLWHIHGTYAVAHPRRSWWCRQPSCSTTSPARCGATTPATSAWWAVFRVPQGLWVAIGHNPNPNPNPVAMKHLNAQNGHFSMLGGFVGGGLLSGFRLTSVELTYVTSALLRTKPENVKLITATSKNSNRPTPGRRCTCRRGATSPPTQSACCWTTRRTRCVAVFCFL
jgi:hypothetical protein